MGKQRKIPPPPFFNRRCWHCFDALVDTGGQQREKETRTQSLLLFSVKNCGTLTRGNFINYSGDCGSILLEIVHYSIEYQKLLENVCPGPPLPLL